jgi:hypothetical protein
VALRATENKQLRSTSKTFFASVAPKRLTTSLPARKRKGIKVSATRTEIWEWNSALSKSRVHATCFEITGQPFYGGFVDGGDNKTKARF